MKNLQGTTGNLNSLVRLLGAFLVFTVNCSDRQRKVFSLTFLLVSSLGVVAGSLWLGERALMLVALSLLSAQVILHFTLCGTCPQPCKSESINLISSLVDEISKLRIEAWINRSH